jgi:hypothetical protein
MDKAEALSFLRAAKAKSKFPFIPKIALTRRGVTDKVLWELHREGHIRPRDGIKGRIIEIL